LATLQVIDHKPDSMSPLLSSRPSVSFSASLTLGQYQNYCLVTEVHHS